MIMQEILKKVKPLDSNRGTEIGKEKRIEKSNNNHRGYFHQKSFQYMANCIVPSGSEESCWDVMNVNAHFRQDEACGQCKCSAGTQMRQSGKKNNWNNSSKWLALG